MVIARSVLVGLVVGASLGGAAPIAAQEFKVVVHAQVPLDGIPTSELANIFQKKERRLPSGETAAPIDQGESSEVREIFSLAVHGRSARQIAAYWQQQIFSGRDFPPDEGDSDAEVLAYVASTPGAIGYVSADCELIDGVKAIVVQP